LVQVRLCQPISLDPELEGQSSRLLICEVRV
jgi:hypothetical protein